MSDYHQSFSVLIDAYVNPINCMFVSAPFKSYVPFHHSNIAYQQHHDVFLPMIVRGCPYLI